MATLDIELKKLETLLKKISFGLQRAQRASLAFAP